MSFLSLLILAVVQGLTEFLPVSSSGHLVLSRALLGVTVEHPLVLDVALHVGTLVAIVAVYHREVRALLGACFRCPQQLAGREPLDESSRLLLRVLVGTIPALIVGLALKDRIEEAFSSVQLVAIALLATAGVLILADRLSRGREMERHLGYGLALLIGCAQAIAILPGCSRSGWTISLALILGIGAQRAARFSFLLALPAIGGAALLQCKELLEGTTAVGFTAFELGTAVLVSALTGYAACRTLLLVLRRGALRYFGFYCALVGLAALIAFTL